MIYIYLITFLQFWTLTHEISRKCLTQNAERDAGEDEDGAEGDGPARVPQAGVRHLSYTQQTKGDCRNVTTFREAAQKYHQATKRGEGWWFNAGPLL